MKIKDNDFLKAIFSIITFFYMAVVIVLTIKLVGGHIDKDNFVMIVGLDVLSSTIVAILLIIMHRKLLKVDISKTISKDKKVLKNFLSLLGEGFIIFFLVKIGVALLEGSIFELFGLESETSDNQALIELMTGSAPVLMTISACIFAPINEELVFRGAIGKVIKNKRVFITVSGLIFGLMHVTDSMVLLLEILLLGYFIDLIVTDTSKSKESKIKLSVLVSVIILLIFGGIYYGQYGNLISKIISLDVTEVIGSITYIGMGLYLAYLYRQHDNIYLNILVHSLNNVFAMAMLLFFA